MKHHRKWATKNRSRSSLVISQKEEKKTLEVRIEKLVDIEWLKIDTSMDVLEVLDVNEPVSWFVFLQQVRKGPVLNQLYFRAIKDIQYVMSHLEVTQYIAQECQELARAWLHLLALCKACILGTWVLILVTDVSWAGVRQLFEDNEWPVVDYDVSKQEAWMWHHNSYSASDLCDLYHTVHCLELDFFLLQCCSVTAPPEEFVEQIQAHFGLTDCVSLVLQCPNEYGILSNFNYFQGLLFCTLEREAQVCNRLQEVSTTALLETAIGAAVGDRDDS
ncbi:unnamed protein product [Sphagnum jensenii]|uniref:E3 ubiquitin-protein ligase n=1 Tax=Sphagnum jensenii TaxID=128206 RepID=A0ABP0W0Y1_9BRYO